MSTYISGDEEEINKKIIKKKRGGEGNNIDYTTRSTFLL